MLTEGNFYAVIDESLSGNKNTSAKPWKILNLLKNQNLLEHLFIHFIPAKFDNGLPKVARLYLFLAGFLPFLASTTMAIVLYRHHKPEYALIKPH